MSYDRHVFALKGLLTFKNNKLKCELSHFNAYLNLLVSKRRGEWENRQRHLVLSKELKEGRRKFFFSTIPILSASKMCVNSSGSNWCEQFGDNKKTLKICRLALAPYTQPKDRSFHFVNWTKAAAKCTSTIIARAKLFFIVKYAYLRCS